MCRELGHPLLHLRQVVAPAKSHRCVGAGHGLTRIILGIVFVVAKMDDRLNESFWAHAAGQMPPGVVFRTPTFTQRTAVVTELARGVPKGFSNSGSESRRFFETHADVS